MPKPDLPQLHAQLLASAPLVQAITNTVVQQFSANVLLAMGASPAMFDHEADAARFTDVADALLVNFGTATNQQLLAADVAMDAAGDGNTPWVLDPVSVGAGDFRTRKIRQALARHPGVLRGNASEILILSGQGAGARGVDAVDEVDAALPAALELARGSASVVAVSGRSDAVVAVFDDHVRVARIAGGHALMTRVVGTGCALGAAVAAYLGAAARGGRSLGAYFDATVVAHAHFALAGSRAGQRAAAPGSFAAAFLDSLYALQSDDFTQAQVHVETRSLGAARP